MFNEVVECDLCKRDHNLLYTFTPGRPAWNKGVPSRSKREGEIAKPVNRSRPCVKIVRLSEPCALHDDCILFARPNTSTWSGEGHSAHFSTQPTHFCFSLFRLFAPTPTPYHIAEITTLFTRAAFLFRIINESSHPPASFQQLRHNPAPAQFLLMDR